MQGGNNTTHATTHATIKTRKKQTNTTILFENKRYRLFNCLSQSTKQQLTTNKLKMLPPKTSHTIRIKTMGCNRFANVEWTHWQDCVRKNYTDASYAFVKLRISTNMIIKRDSSEEEFGTTILKREYGMENLINEIKRDINELYIECIRIKDEESAEEDKENGRTTSKFHEDIDDDYYQQSVDYISHNETTGEITVLIKDNTPSAGYTQTGDGQHLIDRIRAIEKEKEYWEIPN